MTLVVMVVAEEGHHQKEEVVLVYLHSAATEVEVERHHSSLVVREEAMVHACYLSLEVVAVPGLLLVAEVVQKVSYSPKMLEGLHTYVRCLLPRPAFGLALEGVEVLDWIAKLLLRERALEAQC